MPSAFILEYINIMFLFQDIHMLSISDFLVCTFSSQVNLKLLTNDHSFSNFKLNKATLTLWLRCAESHTS